MRTNHHFTPHHQFENTVWTSAVYLIVVSAFVLLPLLLQGQISQVGSATTATGVASLTINKPAGIQTGDMMIATISYNENSGNIDLDVAPLSSGWTLLQDVNLDNGNGDDEWRGAVFYKIAVASDLTATNYLFDLDDQTDGAVGGIIAFNGVDPLMPFDVAAGTINVTNASTITALSKTTVNPNAAIVMLAMVSDNNSISGWNTTAPGALAELFDAGTSNGGDSQVGAAWAIKAGVGPTGNGTANMGATDQSGGIILALRENCSSTPPDVPAVTASPLPFCVGQTVTLTITGNLHHADYWAIYTGSCGGTLVGTTTSNAFMVNPSMTTTYFVRGEGSCVTTPGSCGQVTAQLNPNPPSCSTPVYPSDQAADIPLSSNLEWQATSCVSGYKIYFGTNFPPSNIENGTDLGSVLSYNPASLTANTTYYWRIVPYNSNGDAVGCDTWEFTTSDGTPGCTTPVFPIPESAGLNPSGVTLQWDTEPDASSYVLYFGTNNPPTNIVNGTNLGNVTTYATGPLTNGTTYYWRIRPQNNFGNAGTCAVWSFTTDLDGVVFCDDCSTPPTEPECQDPGTDTNPDIMAACAAISIAFVIDESGSVLNNQAEMEEGTMNFLSSLSCTGASVAMIEFNGYGRFLVDDYTYVDDAFIDAAQSYFDDTPVAFMNNEIYQPNAYPSNDQGTNWHAALLAVDVLPYAPDLIIFLTDGVPTGYSIGANPTYDGPFDYCGAGNTTQNPEIVNPIKLTNKFKAEGSHVFVIGVGNVTLSSIQEISGTTEFVPGTNTIGDADYAIGSFADLAQGLAEIVSDLCPFISEVISSDICPNASDGSISISVPNNLLPYNYAYYNDVTNVFLGGANNVNTTPLIITGLPVGTYRIEIEYTLPGSGCTRTEIFFEDITAGAVEVAAAVTSTDQPTCENPNAGSATLTITAGVVPFTITLKKGGVTQPGYPVVTNTNPYTATGLDFGSYTFEVFDVNNCNVDINPFSLNEPVNCCPDICSVTGGPDVNICPNAESTFTVLIQDCQFPSYAWSILNNTSGATIIGSSTSATVIVNAGTFCGTYTLISSVTCADCAPVVCTKTIQVADPTSPLISMCPQTRLIEGCSPEAVTSPPYSTVTTMTAVETFENAINLGSVSDNCGIASVTYIDVTMGSCPFTITRLWTISDVCGNTSTCQQTIVVDDTIQPTVTSCPITRTIEGCGTSAISGPAYSVTVATSSEAEFENQTNQGVVFDSCGIALVTYVDVAMDTCPVIVNRTWTIHDACGNSAQCSQFIYIDDTIDPIFSLCPSEVISLGCNPDVITEAQVIADAGLAVDACDPITYTAMGGSISSVNCTYEQIWIVTATDACGNQDQCQISYSWTIDMENPVLTCPSSPLDLGCNPPDMNDDGIPDDILTSVPYQDQCDGPGMTSTYTDTLLDLSGCERSLVRTFYHTDLCGHTGSCQVTITWVVDRVDPVLTCPSIGMSLGCNPVDDNGDGIPDAVVTSVPWTDDCDGAGVTNSYIDTEMDLEGCGRSITRIFSYTDGCGNTGTCQAIYDWTIDIVPPSVTFCPANTTIHCSASPEFGLPMAMDACDTAPVTSVSSTVTTPGDCLQEYSVTRTWVFRDACGNVSAPCSQTITVTDDMSPVVTFCPPNVTIECPATPEFGLPMAMDACDSAPVMSVSSTVTAPGDCPQEYSVTRTWVFRDACGNVSAPCSQTITVTDNTAPVVTFCPPDVTMACPEMPEFGTPTASDLCDASPLMSISSTVTTLGDCPQEYNVTRTWVFRDVCGNVSVPCSQSITVTDNIAPVVTFCPPDMTIACPATPEFGTPTASDNCDASPIISISSTMTEPGDCLQSYTVTRTWVFRDACGNISTSCSQSITLTDNTAPVVTFCPQDTIIACSASPEFGLPMAMDACDTAPVMSVSSTVTTPGDCPQEYSVTRTWVFRDACGNVSAPCSQTITVTDDMSPVVTFCPPNVTIECPATPEFGLPMAMDACDSAPVMSVSSTVTTPGDCTQEYSVTRTWIFRDACGNVSAPCTQTITVTDNTAPVVTYCPPTMTITCPAIPEFGMPAANDLCDASPLMSISSTISTPGDCPQEYSVTRTWVFRDVCGNVSVPCSQTIIVTDNAAPVVTFCPPNQTIECQDVPVWGTPTATDNCDPAPISSTSSLIIIPGTCPQEYTMMRTWVFRDDCGNTSLPCSQTIVVIDTTSPVVTYCPPDLMTECPATPEFGIPVASDACDVMPVISISSTVTTPGDCPLEYSVTRTWVFRDGCGNVSVPCSQTITVKDDMGPEVTFCPPDMTFECPSTPEFGLPVAMDACDTAPVMSVASTVTTPGICPQEYSMTRTWVFRDACGNVSAPCIQTITVTDDTAPAVTFCPPDLTIACPATPEFGIPAASDICDATPLMSVSSTVTAPGECPQEYSVTRTWVFRDACGNVSAPCSQTILVTDNTAPVVTFCPPNMTIACPAIPDFGIPTATDICDASPIISISSTVTTPGTCPQEYSMTRTWVFRDACGNTSLSCAQTVSVTDDTAPVITFCPPNQTIECQDVPVWGTPTATDNCDATPMSSTSSLFIIPGACSQEYTMMRTWVFRDDCGNTSSSCSQTIFVIDSTAPVIVYCPPDVTLACPSDPVFGIPVATDICDQSPILSISSTITTPGPSCPDEYIVTRKWVFRDSCGNTSLPCFQTITVIDTNAPTIICPLIEYDTVFCPAIPEFPNAIAMDGCEGSVMMTFTDISLPGECEPEYTITRTWTATDNCGNTSTCSRTIWVRDTMAPQLICPSDTLMDCHSDVTPLHTGFAVATDACESSTTLTYSDLLLEGSCTYSYLLQRTWYGRDICGNESYCQQIITVQDLLAPDINCPADTVIDCHTATSPTSTGIAMATDLCDTNVVISFSENILPAACPEAYTILRTWYAIDDCGNIDSCLQTIEVQDTLAPVVACPPDTIVDCYIGTTPDITGFPFASDACDGQPAVTYNDLILEGPCLEAYIILRTWIAEDRCGHQSSCVQSIIVQDTLPPVIQCPGDTVVDCHVNIHPSFLGGATASDECDTEVLLVYHDVIELGDCPHAYTVYRTWEARDNCTNVSLCVQVISVRDTLAPALACPADTVIDCQASSLPEDTGIALAEDFCDEAPVVTYNDILMEGPCVQAFIVLRTWIAEDICGNVTTCLQTIVVQDTTPPALFCPPDTVIDCMTGTLPPFTGSATAMDGCDIETDVFYLDQMASGGCPQTYVIYRTWYAADDCDNSQSCTQTIVVQDTLAPLLVCPADTMIVCHTSTWPAATGMALASDLCDPGVTITFSDHIEQGECLGEFLIMRTWLAKDDCQNISACIQHIVVQDTMAPAIICPRDTMVNCNTSTLTVQLGEASATDLCDGGPDITWQDLIVPGDCPQDYQIHRTWFARDACDNVDNCLQVIAVQDTVPPVCLIQSFSIDTVVNPDTGYLVLTPDMFDNGSYDACGSVTMAMSPDTIACTGEGEVFVTMTVTDQCGNSTSCATVVQINCIDPCIQLNTWVYLEGAATDPNGLPVFTFPMRTSLNNLRVLPGQTLTDPFFGVKYTPPGQPYDQAPWYYPGTEGDLFDSGGDPSMGDAGYPPSVVDWVLVSLRSSPYDTVGESACMAAGLLHRNGWVEMVEGFECCGLDFDSSYFLIIEHRNHLIVMSDDSLQVQYDQDSTYMVYDFRTQESYIDDPFMFGFFTGQRQILPGIYAMASGNGELAVSQNADTDINFDDRAFWESQNGEVGEYRRGDYNLNGDTNFNDRVTWERNNGKFTSVPRD